MISIFKQKFVLIAAISVVILFIVSISYVNNNNDSTTKVDGQAELYYLNFDTKILEQERKTLTATNVDDKVVEVLQYLFETTPASANLKCLTDGQRPYQEFEIIDSTVIVYLNNVYHDLNNIDKLFARASMTWSLTSIEGVSNIMFYDSGNVVQLGLDENSVLHNRANVRLNPTIDPTDTVAMDFKLYFSNEDFTSLVDEMQTVYVNPDNLVEEYIVNQLIEGTKVDGNKNVIPQGTKLVKVERENRICYVNLSGDFVSKMPNDIQRQELAVYSIVNSLTELNNVDNVQILIDSKRITAFGNELDLKNTLSFNEDIIQ